MTGSVHQGIVRVCLTLLGWAAAQGVLLAADKPLTTYDGRHSISTIALTVVYFVPKDRTPLPDWRDRIDYYTHRVVAFHERELGGRSKVKPIIHPKPLVSDQDTAAFRKGDQNATFFSTMDNVRKLLPWEPKQDDGFPVLLVMSDINWREMDDFRRLRLTDKEPVHEGNIARDGRHFPGAESGGARATYIRRPGYGMGLVSADGWRVPYSGSDCVVYHEGLGHSIGLPHPEPLDDTVMGTAQYKFWINECSLNMQQKRTLGWSPPEEEPDRSRDLFTHFTALQDPIVPTPGQAVTLKPTWPQGAEVKDLTVQLQTDLLGPWVTIPQGELTGAPAHLRLGSFDRTTPVSYRVKATLKDGQQAEIWGYFQVRASGRGPGRR